MAVDLLICKLSIHSIRWRRVYSFQQTQSITIHCNQIPALHQVCIVMEKPWIHEINFIKERKCLIKKTSLNWLCKYVQIQTTEPWRCISNYGANTARKAAKKKQQTNLNECWSFLNQGHEELVPFTWNSGIVHCLPDLTLPNNVLGRWTKKRWAIGPMRFVFYLLSTLCSLTKVTLLFVGFSAVFLSFCVCVCWFAFAFAFAFASALALSAG